jgi:PEP-CTERM motif
MNKLLIALALFGAASAAFAEPVDVPEPQTFGLVAAGLVAAVWVARRNKK